MPAIEMPPLRLTDRWWAEPEYSKGPLELPGQSRLSKRGRELLESMSQLVSGGKLSLPQLPKAAAATLKLLNEAGFEAEDIARTIGTDPVLAAEVLRHANSSLYGARVPIDSLLRAILHVGLRKIRSLILQVTVQSAAMVVRTKSYAMMEWQFAIHCAVFSKALALKTGIDAELAYLAGLLRDIGRLPLLQALELKDALEPQPVPDGDTEIILEVLHRGVGTQVAKTWDLPPAVCDAVSQHINGRADDEDSPAQFPTTRAAEAAGDICHALGFGRFRRAFNVAHARSLKDLGLGEPAIEKFLKDELPRAVEAAKAMA
jgi:HD-like signal output (HDOD) protein